MVQKMSSASFSMTAIKHIDPNWTHVYCTTMSSLALFIDLPDIDHVLFLGLSDINKDVHEGCMYIYLCTCTLWLNCVVCAAIRLHFSVRREAFLSIIYEQLQNAFTL